MPFTAPPSTQAMSSKSPLKDLKDKIGRTNIGCENKENLQLIVTILTTVQHERIT